MSSVKIGIIGVGQIGKFHLDQYQKIPDAEIVAACDTDAENLEKVCAKYNIPKKYSDFRKLLDNDEIVAVDVCLHNNYHAPVTIAALQAGKHVYCEKPIAGSYIDGKNMFNEAAKQNKMLHIQLSTLYHSETKAAKILLNEGALGRVFHARSTGYRRRNRPYVDGYGTSNFVKKEICGGGALFDMGIYHIAQVMYLLGAPDVKTMTGKLYQETDMDMKRKSESGYNVEELSLGFVRLSNDISLDIIESWAIHLNKFEGSSIIGSKAGIRLDPFSFHSTYCDLDMDSTLDLEAMERRRHFLNEDEDAYDSSQHHWIAALQGRVDLLPTAEVALKTMLIQEGIYLSHNKGREVSVAEVEKESVSKAVSL